VTDVRLAAVATSQRRHLNQLKQTAPDDAGRNAARLHSFSLLLAYLISRMPRGPLIHRAGAVGPGSSALPRFPFFGGNVTEHSFLSSPRIHSTSDFLSKTNLLPYGYREMSFFNKLPVK
jgi:hypothetical protein